MESITGQIKIKIDFPGSIFEYCPLQEHWENEVGSTRIPLKARSNGLTMIFCIAEIENITDGKLSLRELYAGSADK